MGYSTLTRAQRLACDAWQLIYRDPSLLEQKTWRSEVKTTRTRCGTKLCWGGHVVALDDGQFLFDNPRSAYYDHVLARPSDPISKVKNLNVGYDGETKIGVISVAHRLAALMGVSNLELEKITAGGNTIEDIRKGIIDVLGVDPKTEQLVPKVDPYARKTCSCGDPSCSFNTSRW